MGKPFTPEGTEAEAGPNLDSENSLENLKDVVEQSCKTLIMGSAVGRENQNNVFDSFRLHCCHRRV